MTRPWLTVLGIGEGDLSPSARALVRGAETLVGSGRQLALVPEEEGGPERLEWDGLTQTMKKIAGLRGTPVVVLASGDPMHYGIGVTLSQRFGIGEMTVIPSQGAFSLAAARMGWALQDTSCLSVHGRFLESIIAHFAPGARLLILSADGETPFAVASLLRQRGYGPSRLTVLEHMGGEKENRFEGTASEWRDRPGADLNTIAVECIAGEDAQVLSLAPGLPDACYLHDGQLTKREVRAVTLSSLAPMPGALLWDVGAGSGSVSIEWLRAVHGTRAVAFEKEDRRVDTIARNAAALGVPQLEIVAGVAPHSFKGRRDRPDAVFLGGRVSEAGLLEVCWEMLKPGGRLVANAVLSESEERLEKWRKSHGGNLTRLAVSRKEGETWRALKPITQYRGEKP